jgi:adenylate cyclase class 2
MGPTFEREIKLPFDSAGTARAAVLASGATLVGARRLQDDYLFDTADGRLRQCQSVLRVRLEPGRSFLTFKGPPEVSAMKLRPEIETPVGDGPQLIRILEAAGFSMWFRYQKYREEFAAGHVIVAVDETPVGAFVEIEGDEQGINDMARALGRRPADYVQDSYRGLFVRACAERGRPPTHMLFDRG